MVFMLTFLSCIGGFLFGYDTGIISGALVLIDDEFALTEIQKELVVSLTVVGQAQRYFATNAMSFFF